MLNRVSSTLEIFNSEERGGMKEIFRPNSMKKNRDRYLLKMMKYVYASNKKQLVDIELEHSHRESVSSNRSRKNFLFSFYTSFSNPFNRSVFNSFGLIQNIIENDIILCVRTAFNSEFELDRVELSETDD